MLADTAQASASQTVVASETGGVISRNANGHISADPGLYLRPAGMLDHGARPVDMAMMREGRPAEFSDAVSGSGRGGFRSRLRRYRDVLRPRSRTRRTRAFARAPFGASRLDLCCGFAEGPGGVPGQGRKLVNCGPSPCSRYPRTAGSGVCPSAKFGRHQPICQVYPDTICRLFLIDDSLHPRLDSFWARRLCPALMSL